MSKQMRAAWSRRTDDELLHAYFLEELTPEGARVVAELVAETFGPPEALLERYAHVEGDVVHALPVRSFEVAASLKGQALPVMWGALVLTSRGLAFRPGGHDDELGDDTRLSITDMIAGDFGLAARSIWSDVGRTLRPVASRVGVAIPLPLLAKLDPNTVWLPFGTFDELLWGPDLGEAVCAGERLFTLTPPADAEPLVVAWAAEHQVALTLVEPSFLR